MERIRELRKERGLRQAKLAVMADMDPATLNRLEQGKGNPNLRTLERVAAGLDVKVVNLLGKALAPASGQPSFNDLLAEERRASRLAEAVTAAADAWIKTASQATSLQELGTLVLAALDLHDSVRRPLKEDREAMRRVDRAAQKRGKEVRKEVLGGERPRKAEQQEEVVEQNRARIRELTRRISA